jgi:predicted N-acetyltransferase YhbS
MTPESATVAGARAPSTLAVRPLAATDLDAVVALDAAGAGRSRTEYVARRLRAAQREPALHAQFAAVDERGLAGCVLARVMAGEFGRSAPALRLELIGVRSGAGHAGVGRSLLGALAAWGARHGVAELRTGAAWRDTAMLGWLDAMGFELASDLVIGREVGGDSVAEPDDPTTLGAEAYGGEVDYGRPETNDSERLARGGTDVRAMTARDLDAIVRIDRDVTGRDRRDYIAARLDEALHDSALRMSLAACRDGTVVGYLMARADLGDFGRAEPVAIVDTIGVDPDYGRRGVGRAMLSALLDGLGALRVERVETVVSQRDLALLGFLYAAGFAPNGRLAFVRASGVAR